MKGAKTDRNCPDCYEKANKPEPEKPDLTWLAWKKGQSDVHQYHEAPSKAEEDDRERVPVFLKINNHAPEKLKKVLKKKTTDFEEYLSHGIVP